RRHSPLPGRRPPALRRHRRLGPSPLPPRHPHPPRPDPRLGLHPILDLRPDRRLHPPQRRLHHLTAGGSRSRPRLFSPVLCHLPSVMFRPADLDGASSRTRRTLHPTSALCPHLVTLSLPRFPQKLVLPALLPAVWG